MGDFAEAQVLIVFGARGAPRTGLPDVPAKGLVAVVLVLAFEDAVDDDGPPVSGIFSVTGIHEVMAKRGFGWSGPICWR